MVRATKSRHWGQKDCSCSNFAKKPACGRNVVVRRHQTVATVQASGSQTFLFEFSTLHPCISFCPVIASISLLSPTLVLLPACQSGREVFLTRHSCRYGPSGRV